MWTEKYRPLKIDDVVNQRAVVDRLKSLLKSPGDMPHLLFAGPPGTGKTTTALCIARNIMGDYWRDFTLELNASDERGINTVRDRVKTFARYADRRVEIPFRIIILDEADEMCLHPDTTVLVGGIDNLEEAKLRELYERFGEEPFDIVTLNLRTRKAENDKGKIVPSGTAKLYKITFEDGRTILASSDHPFFTMKGTSVTVVRTRDIRSGTELADFTNRILHCYNCGKIFYRHYPNTLYEHYFCSQDCRNSYFGSLSSKRSAEERRELGLKGAAALLQSGAERTPQYRERRSAIAKQLILKGKIPDPRTWKKFKKGEGAWLGRKLSEDHKRAIVEGSRKYFKQHPEVRRVISEKVKLSLAEEEGSYRELVRSGFFKQASVKAYIASTEYWKHNHFRSKIELKMAELLDKWNLKYVREQLIFRNDAGHPYPLVVDFVIGKVALFVHGCWWHVCPTCGVIPKYEKQRRNMEKDHKHITELEEMGYKVVIVWEHELKNDSSIQNEVLPKIFQTTSIAGGAIPKVKHSRVKSIEYVGSSEVLNISTTKNHNFFLANGILTHNTNDAQTALRRIMETYSKGTRFILICNYSSRIIEPIQSRCAIFRFSRLAEDDVVGYLKVICEKEEVKFEEKALRTIYKVSEGDLRQAINILESVSILGEVNDSNVEKTSGISGKAKVEEVVRLALAGDFKGSRSKLIELTRVYGLSDRDFLKYANEALVELNPRNLGEASEMMAKYDYRLIVGAHPEIQLTALLAELGRIGREADVKSK